MNKVNNKDSPNKQIRMKVEITPQAEKVMHKQKNSHPSYKEVSNSQIHVATSQDALKHSF